MATEAKENLILDALLTAAQLVVGGATYNTNPAVKAIGLPRDATAIGGGEAIYLQHVRTDLQRLPSGPTHDYEAVFHAWCVGDTDREALNVKDDLLRAVRLSEGALQATALASAGFRDSVCVIPDPDTVAKIGKAIRIQEFIGAYPLSG